MQAISVKPIGGQGWMVEFSGAANAQVFASGERAESSARNLAGCLAEAGKPSRITVYLRDGSIGGCFVTSI